MTLAWLTAPALLAAPRAAAAQVSRRVPRGGFSAGSLTGDRRVRAGAEGPRLGGQPEHRPRMAMGSRGPGARALGLTIAPAVLARADEVIQ